MISADYSKPATTDAYALWASALNGLAQGAGALNDPTYVTVSNPYTGQKRFNPSTGVLEQYSGSAWVVLTTNYLSLSTAGTQTMTGTLNAAGLQISGSAVATTTSVTSALASYATLAGTPNFSGTPTVGGSAIASQSWVTSQGYATAASLSTTYAALTGATFTGTVQFGTGTSIAANGDITVLRPAATTTGAIFFGNSGTKYLYMDGTNFNFTSAALYSAVAPTVGSANGVLRWNEQVGNGQTCTAKTYAFSTNYTNSTGKPILVSFTLGSSSGGSNATILMNGNTHGVWGASNGYYSSTIEFVLPAGWYFSITGTGGGPVLGNGTWTQ
jgi:hypothetical protein